jgi:hypothetical protein
MLIANRIAIEATALSIAAKVSEHLNNHKYLGLRGFSL